MSNGTMRIRSRGLVQLAMHNIRRYSCGETVHGSNDYESERIEIVCDVVEYTDGKAQMTLHQDHWQYTYFDSHYGHGELNGSGS